MSNQTKQWGAIIMMIALFAMIAFVTNLCSPMAIIVKNQFGASNVLAQIGNYGNFIAYLVMGIPSGMLIKKYGYKKTALLALIVGIVGVITQWMSGWDSIQSFGVYLVGAFISGFCIRRLPGRRIHLRLLHVYAEHGGQPDAESAGRRRQQG